MATASAYSTTRATLLESFRQGAEAAELVLQEALRIARLPAESRLPNSGDNQRALHGLAWLATYVEAIRQMASYAQQMSEPVDRFGEIEQLMVRIGIGECLAQIVGGISMNQGEIVRLSELGISRTWIADWLSVEIQQLIDGGNTVSNRGRMAALQRQQPHDSNIGSSGLDETLEAMRTEMRRFSLDQVTPHANQWHLQNELIPVEVINQMAALGVFGLTIPEEYGGLGFSKTSMCVVSEELSRGYIGVGSLGTRSEIAAELILCGGSEDQKQKWLPRIASAYVLPTAVFTEPDTGSDLASLKTRAVRNGDTYKIYGSKTWITHAARADLMTLLVRTGSQESGYRGLSLFLAEKPRGNDDNPFPVQGMAGSEIHVLGYRGMKEYEISFDGFEVKAENLLGGVEGEGFRQLMQTFESARIQTAARAVGVAQSALDLAIRYAHDRIQFGKSIFSFSRVSDKIVMMAVEILIARLLTYHAARQKDSGRRCDMEAGMAKLLAARVAWSAADNALQIHGGNGFSVEFPISRVLCDARILNIFEGAAEIQAQVISKRLLESTN